MKEKQAKKKGNGLVRFAKAIERVGNKLPHPFYIFLILIGIVLVVSWACSMAGVSVTSCKDS